MAIVIYLIPILLIAVLGWIINTIMKNKKKEAPKQEAVDPNIAEKETPQASTNLIKVLIFRQLSKDLVAQAGKAIICEEKKDDNNNQIVINEEARFKEDFNFSIDKVYEVMNYNLELTNKTKKQKAEILRGKIKIQRDLLKKIDDNVEENANYNFRDEELKLRQLTVLLDSLKMENNANYMRLGENGIRQYEFVSIDGVLYPYTFGNNWYRAYPDLLIKKKIFNQENTIFKNEMGSLFNKAINWTLILTGICGIVLTIVGAVMITHAYSKNSEVTAAANAGNIKCTNTLATITENYGGIINDYMQVKQTESESIKKNEIPSNNIPSVKDIIVDPTKLN